MRPIYIVAIILLIAIAYITWRWAIQPPATKAPPPVPISQSIQDARLMSPAENLAWAQWYLQQGRLISRIGITDIPGFQANMSLGTLHNQIAGNQLTAQRLEIDLSTARIGH